MSSSYLNRAAVTILWLCRMSPGFARMRMVRPKSAWSEETRSSSPEASKRRPRRFWRAESARLWPRQATAAGQYRPSAMGDGVDAPDGIDVPRWSVEALPEGGVHGRSYHDWSGYRQACFSRARRG